MLNYFDFTLPRSRRLINFLEQGKHVHYHEWYRRNWDAANAALMACLYAANNYDINTQQAEQEPMEQEQATDMMEQDYTIITEWEPMGRTIFDNEPDNRLHVYDMPMPIAQRAIDYYMDKNHPADWAIYQRWDASAIRRACWRARDNRLA